MIVEGYWLVRPGREQEVVRALAMRRRANIGAVVAGVAVWVGAVALYYAVLSPWLVSVIPEAAHLHDGSRFVWPFAIGAALGAAVAWLISTIGEQRWKRRRADPGLLRNAYAFRDRYGDVPDWIPAQDLWDALDDPGGIANSPLDARIMAELIRRRDARDR